MTQTTLMALPQTHTRKRRQVVLQMHSSLFLMKEMAMMPMRILSEDKGVAALGAAGVLVGNNLAR